MTTLGRVYLALEQHTAAMQWIDAALARDPNLAEALYFKAVVHLRSTPKDVPQAIIAARADLIAAVTGVAASGQAVVIAAARLVGFKYPANAAVNAQDEAMRWFEYWLQGKSNGVAEEPSVKYYLMGDVTDSTAPGNEWKTAATWPVPSKATSYYMQASGGLAAAAAFFIAEYAVPFLSKIF